MANIKMTADEKRWRARNDAETLVASQQIQNNSQRYKEALKALQEKQKELNEQVKAYKLAAGGKLKKK